MLQKYYIHNLNPNFITIGPLSIKWYSLSYIIGIVIAYFLITKIFIKKNPLQNNKNNLIIDNLFSCSIISIILGGRLGYVIFYNLPYYLNYPLDIFKLWQGGMSFHGGAIGLGLASWYIAKKHSLKLFQVTDIIAFSAPFGIMLGRIANFINGELYGNITYVKWAVIFPKAGIEPRHPSQLYEAFLEGFVIALIMLIALKLQKKYHQGFYSALFLIIYSIFRIILENFRSPDMQLGYLFAHITMGQLLSFAILLLTTTLIIKNALSKS